MGNKMNLPYDYTQYECSKSCPWTSHQGKGLIDLTKEQIKSLHDCTRYHCLGCKGLGSCEKPRVHNIESFFCVGYESCAGNHARKVCSKEDGTLIFPFQIQASEFNLGFEEWINVCKCNHCSTDSCKNSVEIQFWDLKQDRQQCWACLAKFAKDKS